MKLRVPVDLEVLDTNLMLTCLHVDGGFVPRGAVPRPVGKTRLPVDKEADSVIGHGYEPPAALGKIQVCRRHHRKMIGRDFAAWPALAPNKIDRGRGDTFERLARNDFFPRLFTVARILLG